MNSVKFYLSTLVVMLMLSCNTDDTVLIVDDGEVTPTENLYGTGYFIAHEGAFDGGFGTVSFVNEEFSTVENDIYQSVNGDNLGGILQSMAFSDDRIFVVSNVSNRLTVVDRFTFEEIARIEAGLSNPRYMAIADGKGYITNWGDGTNATDDYIAVVDLDTSTIINNIAVAEGPEQIVFNGNSLYVSHKGGFSVNTIITVINPASGSVETTIPVGDAPDELEIDIEGNLWVLTEGRQSYQGDETGGGFTKINTVSNEIIVSTTLEETLHPSYMDLEGDELFYYLNGAVYSVGINDDLSVVPTPILEDLFFYGMSVSNGQLIGCNAGDFNSDGTIEVYELSTNTLIHTIDVGLIPSKIYPNF